MDPTDLDRVCRSKKVFATRHIAKLAAKAIKRAGKGNLRYGRDTWGHGRLRPYQCRACGLWHLMTVRLEKA